MSITDTLKEQLQALVDEGVDLSSQSQSLILAANSNTPIEFDTVFGDGGRAGVTTGEIILTEASVRPQYKLNTNDDLMLVLTMALACPNAKVWAVEDGELVLHPAYTTPELGLIVNQTPYVYTQLVRSDEEALKAFEAFLVDAEYLPRQNLGQGNFEGVTANIEGMRWALEAKNAQTGDFATDIRVKQANGLRLESATLAASRLVDTDRPQYTDIFDSWTANIMRVLGEVLKVEEEEGTKEQRAAMQKARSLAGSLTGAAPDANGGEQLYALRATCGELVVQGKPVMGGHAPAKGFNFWTNQNQVQNEV